MSGPVSAVKGRLFASAEKPLQQDQQHFYKIAVPSSLCREIRVDNMNVFAPFCNFGPKCPACMEYGWANSRLRKNWEKTKRHPRRCETGAGRSIGFHQFRFTLKARTGVNGAAAQLLLNAQQLVVLYHARYGWEHRS